MRILSTELAGSRAPLGASGLDVQAPPPQLAVSIRDAIERAIQDGRLPPGERINQERVAADLGVSRTPVREALQLLARAGVVKLVPRRGAYVCVFDDQDVDEIYELRALLEPHAAAASCVRATRADITRLQRLEREIEIAASDDLERAFALNRRLHHRLCEPCANGLLLELLETVWSHAAALRTFARYTQDAAALERSHGEHRAIVEAFAARDCERTFELLRAHIAAAHDTLTELTATDRKLARA